MVCNNLIFSPILSGANTVVQAYYLSGVGPRHPESGLPMSLSDRVPDTIDLSILANADARTCFADTIKGASSNGLTGNVVSVEGELYASLTGKDPKNAETADIVAAFQGAQGKVITGKDIIDAYCGEGTRDECDAARSGSQPLVAYIEFMKAAASNLYVTPKQRQEKAVEAAAAEAAKATEGKSGCNKKIMDRCMAYPAQLEAANAAAEAAESKAHNYGVATVATGAIALVFGFLALISALRKRGGKATILPPYHIREVVDSTVLVLNDFKVTHLAVLLEQMIPALDKVKGNVSEAFARYIWGVIFKETDSGVGIQLIEGAKVPLGNIFSDAIVDNSGMSPDDRRAISGLSKRDRAAIAECLKDPGSPTRVISAAKIKDLIVKPPAPASTPPDSED